MQTKTRLSQLILKRKANLLNERWVETALLRERHDFDQMPPGIG